MTKMLEEAFEKASRLSQSDQDTLAAWLIAELESEQSWNRLFARSQDQLGRLADDAIDQHGRGETEPLDLDKL